MKKLFDRLGLETVLGAIFGIIAIVAIIVEMAISEFDSAAIAGGVKDMAGTIVTVMVFIVAVKALFKKEPKTFAELLEDGMNKVVLKYSPLLRRGEDEGDERKANKLAGMVVYELSTNIESLISGAAGEYARFCEFDRNKPQLINFFINKTTFVGRSRESFEPHKELLTTKILNGILRSFRTLSGDVHPTKDGFAVSFDHVLCSKEDAEILIELIDRIVILYVAECKK